MCIYTTLPSIIIINILQTFSAEPNYVQCDLNSTTYPSDTLSYVLKN